MFYYINKNSCSDIEIDIEIYIKYLFIKSI